MDADSTVRHLEGEDEDTFRRLDGTESFWDRKWSDYKNGFGDATGNYWMGNELIHKLSTKDSSVSLKIEMNKDGTPGSAWANQFWWNDYDQFQVSPLSFLFSVYTAEGIRLSD